MQEKITMDKKITQQQLLNYLKKDTSNKEYTDLLIAIVKELNDELIQEISEQIKHNNTVSINIEINDPYFPESDFEDFSSIINSEEEDDFIFVLNINDFNKLINRINQSTKDKNAKEAISHLSNIFTKDKKTASCDIDSFIEVLKTVNNKTLYNNTNEVCRVLKDFVESIQKLNIEHVVHKTNSDDILPF